ncbi:glycerophosphodiester phosphodiesterase family protein [Bacillaceae bacterium IKA-2]|nr:glycerophosphodiester phosphodiesterase family protein [Bacillaceae bacterium IKA-2]
MNPIMAHRGWSGKSPENTLAAIKLAVKEPSISAIELDVQLSKDGIPVIIHDFTVNRTTNGEGFVKDLTMKQLRSLDAGSWFSPDFKGEKIPTLEEVLQTVNGKKILNIELKVAGELYAGLEEKVIETIKIFKVEKDVMITSFDHKRIQKVNKLTSSIKTGLIILGLPTLIEEQLNYTKATILSMSFPYLTTKFVKSHIQNGRTVIAWVPNSKVEIAFVKAIHPDIVICTDFPDNAK